MFLTTCQFIKVLVLSDCSPPPHLEHTSSLIYVWEGGISLLLHEPIYLFILFVFQFGPHMLKSTGKMKALIENVSNS